MPSGLYFKAFRLNSVQVQDRALMLLAKLRETVALEQT